MLMESQGKFFLDTLDLIQTVCKSFSSCLHLIPASLSPPPPPLSPPPPPTDLDSGFGRKDVVDHLLQTGANVHARDDGGLIPLHNACSFGHSEVRLYTSHRSHQRKHNVPQSSNATPWWLTCKPVSSSLWSNSLKTLSDELKNSSSQSWKQFSEIMKLIRDARHRTRTHVDLIEHDALL